MKKSKGKGCCKINRVVISLSILVMLIALALSASAMTLTLQTTTWSLNTLVNISLDKVGTESIGENVTNVAIFASSTSTANSSTSKLINLTNASDQNFMDMASANFTFGSNIVLEDANNYAITAVVTGNGGADAKALASTTVTIDRTAPTAPTSLQPTDNADNSSTDDMAFTIAVNGANTTGCVLYFSGANPGSSAYTMSHSGESCTLTISNIAEATYSWYATATDDTNTSANSGINKFIISQFGSDVGKRAFAISAAGGQEPTKQGVGEALGILQAEEAGARAGAKFGQTIKQELTDKKELTKTGIGIGTGAVAGMAIGTLVLPGIGTMAGLPVGAFIGGFIGALA